VVLVGFGLAALFDTYPALRQALTGVAVLYMLWLAYKIATASAPEDSEITGKPFTFLQAAAFQWVNPKGIIMAITAQTAYAQGTSIGAVLLVGVSFLCVNLPSISLWAWLGQEMRRILTNPTRLKLFNWAMAVLLVTSLIPILFK